MKNWTHNKFTIHQFPELESTNSRAFQKAEAREISEFEIILADQQSAGRGRMSRDWFSPKGNLYFSMILQPRVEAHLIPQISFLGILALRLAVEKLTKNSVKNKWPNDLLINEKKVAGLLLESKFSHNICEFIVLGIGVNIDSSPEHAIFPADNLKNLGVEISPQKLLKNFLDEFEKIYQNWLDFGFENSRKLWLKGAFRLHETITVKTDEGKLEGIFENLDEEGNLLIKSGEKISKISAADIS